MAYNEAVNQATRPVPQGPEERIFKLCYAPADLRQMLASADSRSKIRRLSVPHLFFGLSELTEAEIVDLVPHVTERQWQGVLDLACWAGDRMSAKSFLAFERHILRADDAVARKLVRAVDPNQWELFFKTSLHIYPEHEEDDFAGPESEEEILETPGGECRLGLPGSPEKQELLKGVLLRLYELDSEGLVLALGSARSRTAVEMEETAYQNRKRRIEDLGFQDYFEAIEIYGYLPPGSPLPQKDWGRPTELSLLPVQMSANREELLLLKTIADLQESREVDLVLGELLFVCNKLLAADRVSPSTADRVKETIGKAIGTINLGLEQWSESKLDRAREGIRRHYLQSFFQLGHSGLLDLQREFSGREKETEVEAGSFAEAVLEGISRRFPRFVFLQDGKIKERFFTTVGDLETIRRCLH